MSSPATYPRCSAKSTEAPKYGDRCIPLMNPSTTDRATSSRLPIRARTTGSTNRAPGIAPDCSVLRIVMCCRVQTLNAESEDPTYLPSALSHLTVSPHEL